MAKEINKSINIVISETKEKLVQVISQSQLPAAIMEMIIREVAENVYLQSKQILEQEKVQYQKMLQDAVQKKEGNKK